MGCGPSRVHFCFFRRGHDPLSAGPDLLQELVPAGAGAVEPVADRVLFGIILVVVFGRIKRPQRKNLGCNRVVEAAFGFRCLLGSLGQLPLLAVRIEYDTAVLRSPVDKLSAGMRGAPASGLTFGGRFNRLPPLIFR